MAMEYRHTLVYFEGILKQKRKYRSKKKVLAEKSKALDCTS